MSSTGEQLYVCGLMYTTLETTFEEFVHMTPVRLKFEYRNNDIVSVSMPEQQLEEPEQQQVEPEKQQVEPEKQQVKPQQQQVDPKIPPAPPISTT